MLDLKNSNSNNEIFGQPAQPLDHKEYTDNFAVGNENIYIKIIKNTAKRSYIYKIKTIFDTYCIVVVYYQYTLLENYGILKTYVFSNNKIYCMYFFNFENFDTYDQNKPIRKIIYLTNIFITMFTCYQNILYFGDLI